MIEVGRFATRADAEFARSLLAAAAIPCVLVPEEAADAHVVCRPGGARVLVADADAPDAAVILGYHARCEEGNGQGR